MQRGTLLTIVLGIALLVVVALILRNTVFKPALAGLAVRAVPTGTVYVNDKSVGQTPYEGQNLTEGETLIKIAPEDTTGLLPNFEKRIKLVGGTQTVINWEFGESESSSSGEVMTLEKIADKKTASLTVISSPDSGLVKMTGEPKGFTPLSLEKLEPGERIILLSAAGFAERETSVTLRAGFKLVLNVKLAEKSGETGTPTPTSLTPTPSGRITPSPGKTTPTPTSLKKPYVTIKETETGWLRVRIEPSKSATEAARVKPGESFPLLEQKSGWYKIRYQTTGEGWISSQYAEKFE